MATLAVSNTNLTHHSPGLLTAVVLGHVGVLLALLAAPDVVEPFTPPRAHTVSLIELQIEEPQPHPELKPTPPAPQPAIKPLPPPPVLTAQRPLPTPEPQPVTEAPKPLPEPVPELLPTPAPVVEAPKPAPPASPPPPSPPRPADYLTNPKPPYPSLSRRLREEGTVSLNILVNPDGSVARLELARSSGFARLDQSALDTVQSSWKFEPARQGGKPVAAWVIVPIQFTLRS